ncbi:MAG TPA: L,D-transpeptidase family protein, partial [Bacillota bacterium]|nr:L,D-transpeptidase family protein [Bacillota bacterium]
MKISRYYVTILYIVFFALLYIGMENYEADVFNQFEHNLEVGEVTGQKIIEGDGSKYDILIDLSESTLYLFEDGIKIKQYPVAQGKPGTPSPIGVWHITNKARNWGTGFGTRWMGLDVPWGLYGIHGTNKPGSIGYRASGGCFRMRNKDVEELYSIVPYKTKVVVYGGPYANMGSSLSRLAPGDRNSQVLEVQIRLRNLGYYEGSIDGIYG